MSWSSSGTTDKLTASKTPEAHAEAIVAMALAIRNEVRKHLAS